MPKLPSRFLAPLAALVIAAILIIPAGTAQAATLPAGKSNYVVSFGSLENPGGNWVRLGTYQFGADGRVRSTTWAWSQADPAARVGTGTIPEGGCSGTTTTVRECEVKTVSGFKSAASEVRGGDYTLHTASDGREFVNIQWDASGWRSEEWFVELSPDRTYSRLSFKYSQKFTHGYGYGSNRGLSERRAMSTVRDHQAPLRMTYWRATHGTVTPVEGKWTMSNYKHCTGTTWCLTYKIPEASTACRCAAPHDDDHSIQNHIQQLSSHDRRDTFWHWCTCLAKDSPCYKGNSHVYPLLQIIDDNGGWRGWVGVETAFYPYDDPSGSRKHDMLSVFRVAEWV